ncbi:MAG TPA: Nif11-like leader peptide family natural product precursor [Chthoniobacterales bacterium]|nr:Nif11-like leader peptide family natural product precursor [Chthoniobacterales bacterium]
MEGLDERENLERFGDLVLADPKLHDQLRAATPEDFAALAVRLGAERACYFSAPVVVDALLEQRRAWLERWF